jgi:hypothetical protein
VLTVNPLRWIPWIMALGLVYSLYGCYRTEEPGEHGNALVADAAPAAPEVREPRRSAALAARPHDNRTQVTSSALYSNHGMVTEQSPASLLDALLWVAAGESPEQSTLLAELSDSFVQQGAAALFEVRKAIEALARSPFAVYPDQSEFGQLAALIDVLLQFEAQEVEAIVVDLLDEGVPPQIVCRLAGYLEASRPGVYDREIRLAAEHALNAAGDDTPIPGQLFQYLGQTGDASIVPLLAGMPSHRDAYASVALALIADGNGLPLIESDARYFESGRDTMQGRLAVELLAQLAPRSPDAAAVLLELAERELIPEDIWPHVVELVEGRWELTLMPPGSGVMGTHTIYRPEGNQVIYRVARQEKDEDPAISDQRLGLLDSLRRLAPSPMELHE